MSENFGAWGLASSTTFSEFALRLAHEGILETRALEGAQKILRYTRPGVSVYEVALSLRPDSYISHNSALVLNQLTTLLPFVVYANKEQPSKGTRTPLSQAAIDRAFSNKQRTSANRYRYDEWEIVLVNGKNTGNLEVGEITIGDGWQVRCTRLERSLIDAVVRPAYSGGPQNVLNAFVAAKGQLQIQKLRRVLRLIDFAYPYHQAIGYYLERAGYTSEYLDAMREPGLNFDFYLTHGMREKELDRNWRLWVPKGL